MLRTIGVALNFFSKSCNASAILGLHIYLCMNEARCVDENLPNVNKTKHPTTKGEKKGTRWMDPSSYQKKKSPTRAYHKGNMNKSRTQTSPLARSMS